MIPTQPTGFDTDDHLGSADATTADRAGQPTRVDDRRDSNPSSRFDSNPDDSSPSSDGIITTGTTTLGLTGADGVVLAADTRASLGGKFVTNRTARKIEPVADRIAVAFAGSVSDAQSFLGHLRAELRQYELERDRSASVETAATVAGDLVRRGPYRILDLVLAGVDDEPAVYQIGGGGGVMRSPYAASGSGMQLAYGALEAAYEPDRPMSELRPIAARAVRSATERDTASGDGMTIATITADDLAIEQFDDLERAVAAAEGGDRDNSEATAGDEADPTTGTDEEAI